MNSIETQIPFTYYYLNISKPNPLVQTDDSLGELFTGDYTYFTNYEVGLNNIDKC
jgi:hypothetical protein